MKKLQNAEPKEAFEKIIDAAIQKWIREGPANNQQSW
jgi:hypothetical protein